MIGNDTLDLVLEAVRSALLLAIVIFVWRARRREPMRRQPGWSFILAGFVLILVGSLFDITDEIEGAERFVIVGDTIAQSVIEKVFGFLLGSALLAIGFWRLFPALRVGRAATIELKRAHDELEERVTERTAKLRDAMAEAEAASRAKSRFLAQMSHELRTPLNSVIGFSNRMLNDEASVLRDEHAVYVKRIADNGEQLLELINQILDLAKVESGRVDVETEPVDVASVLEDIRREYGDRFRERGLGLDLDVPDALQPVSTDRVRLHQIFANLVENSLKFTESGAVTLRITAAAHDGRPTRVDVVDTGVGIPKEHQARIFEAFEQAEPAMSSVYGGTGLGLSICQSLCRALGLRLEVTSDVGRGSTFSVVFPD